MKYYAPAREFHLQTLRKDPFRSLLSGGNKIMEDVGSCCSSIFQELEKL